MTPQHFQTRTRVITRVGDTDQSRTIDVSVVLDVDVDSLIRQLTASALVSDSHPKQATRVQGAVVLTITEEVATSL